MSDATADEEFGVRVGAYAARLRVARTIAPVVRSALRDLVVDVASTDSVALVEAEPDGAYRVSADGRLFQSGVQEDAVTDHVVRMLLLAELDTNVGRLHLHGGLVAVGDAGVLVAGRSGAGKTTLITSLVRAGFDYVTDERVAVDVERGVATGFAKPVSLVPGSFPLFADLDPAVTGVGYATERVWQVPVSSFGPGELRAEAAVRVIVIVQHRAGAELSIERLHPATVAADLLLDSPDQERFGPDATAVAGALCAHAVCVRLTYDRLADAERAVRELLHQDRPEPDVEVLAPANGARPTRSRGGRLGASHVVVRTNDRPLVVVEGRTLAYVRDGAELAELDETTTAWLLLVDGRSTVAELVDAVQRDTGADRGPLLAGALGVLRGLATHGLVARA